MKISTLVLLFVFGIGNSVYAQDGQNRPQRPPPFFDELTAEQKTQLQNATTMEEKNALIESWFGIRLPSRPPRGQGPNFMDQLTEEQKAQLSETHDMEERKKLIESWLGIKLPPRPERRPSNGRPSRGAQ